MAVVYQHITKLDKTVFYIGIGKKDNRAFNFTKRSKFWKDFTKNHEFDVEILYDNISYEEAKRIEIKLISEIGRRDLGKGNLVNQTDGGEGAIGRKFNHTEESKSKISVNNGMYRTDVKEKHKNSLNRPETKEKQRIAKIGKIRPKKLCIFCNKEIADNNYAKYHGNNCKLKKPNDE